MQHNLDKFNNIQNHCNFIEKIMNKDHLTKLNEVDLEKLIKIAIHFEQDVKIGLMNKVLNSEDMFKSFNQIWEVEEESPADCNTLCHEICGRANLCGKIKSINSESPLFFPTFIPPKYNETFTIDLFTQYYKDRIIFHNPTLNFYEYINGVWQIVNDKKIHALMEEFLINFFPSDQINNNKIETLTKRLMKQSDIFFEEQMNPDKSILNFANGLYNLETNSLESHTPNYKTTVQFPVEYDPEAECPLFIEKINEMLEGNKEVIDHLLKWMMYTMIPTYEFQKALLLVGKGGNGKSVIMNVWRELIGDDNISNQEFSNLADGQHYSAFQLVNKYANFSNEVSGLEKDAYMFKALTGDDKISCRQIKEKPIEFKNMARLIISANSYPKFKVVDNAIIRRLDIISFNKSFIKRPDTQLSRKLITEIPGILNLVLNKYKEIVLHDGGIYFESPGDVLKNITEFKEASDSVAVFVKEKCVLGNDETPSYASTLSSLYLAYKSWCTENYGDQPKTKPVFTEELNSLYDCNNYKIPSIKNLEENAVKKVNWITDIRLDSFSNSDVTKLSEVHRLLGIKSPEVESETDQNKHDIIVGHIINEEAA
ncbi:MAG: hypothetical protein JEY94_07380 [Melioribacteraceae bacterium]|nr:hypothetical protein [Melioribacteraceae bacterium]